MSEDSEMWAEYRGLNQKKRWENFDKSLEILAHRQVPYKILSHGAGHLRVAEVWDFWPTTGKFYNSKTKEKGRGVFNLLKKV